MEVKVFVTRVQPGAALPTYAHGAEEDAGLDLVYCGSNVLILAPGGRQMCPTGIAILLPA